jgi:hypothetical protein
LQIVDMFKTWYEQHGEKPVKVKAISEPVRALLDPQGCGRHFTAARLVQLACTRCRWLCPQAAASGGKMIYE